MSEVAVAHVVVTRSWDRSIQRRVAMTLLLATFGVVLLLSSLSTSSNAGTSLLAGIHETDLVKIVLKLSHDAVDMLPGGLMVRLWGIPHEVT